MWIKYEKEFFDSIFFTTTYEKGKSTQTYHKATGQTQKSHCLERISYARSLPVCGTSGGEGTPLAARDWWREKRRRRGKTADNDGASPWSQSSMSGQTDPAPRTENECATSLYHWQEWPSGGWRVEGCWAPLQFHYKRKKQKVGLEIHYLSIKANWYQHSQQATL